MSLPEENLSTVENFLENEAFRSWMIDRRTESELYWKQWVRQNPDKQEVFEQAVATFLAIQGNAVNDTEQEIRIKRREILNQLSDPLPIRRPVVQKTWVRWAALLMIVGFIGWIQGGRIDFRNWNLRATLEEYGFIQQDWKEIRNLSKEPMVVLLPDHSSVLLSSGSQLRFNRHMSRPIREVFLQGEGFFEVAKNPDKPFLVYTKHLTTKVIGTSFQIRSFEREDTASVKVKTGKVTVTPANFSEEPVLLSVHQELKVQPSTKQVIKREHFSLSQETSSLIAEPFAFHYTPISEIFDKLEADYHMPIQYDPETLKHCTFTGKLNDLPFLEKIRLICLTIDSSYEVINNRIVIQSNGCRS